MIHGKGTALCSASSATSFNMDSILFNQSNEQVCSLYAGTLAASTTSIIHDLTPLVASTLALEEPVMRYFSGFGESSFGLGRGLDTLSKQTCPLFDHFSRINDPWADVASFQQVAYSPDLALDSPFDSRLASQVSICNYSNSHISELPCVCLLDRIVIDISTASFFRFVRSALIFQLL